MPQLVIVADDLTGAADASASFAKAGLSTVIHLSGAAIPNADVVAVSTESRDLGGTAAAATVRSAFSRKVGGQRDAAPRWIYNWILTQSR
jgi:D-threonate/D-erythronate kinase